MLLIHHGLCFFEDVPVFAFGHTVLLRCVSASEFLPNSFLWEVHRKIVRDILLGSVRSNASYMSTSPLFNFAFEFLEMSEHFSVLPHWVDPGVLGEVVDKEHVISTSVECSLCSLSSLSGTGVGVAFQIGMLHTLLQSLSL